MKNRFWRYGTKVKKWDDRLLMRSVIFCMLLSLILSVFLLGNVKVSAFSEESPLLSRIAAILLFGAMLCVSIIAVLGRQRKVREYIENRQALARMIIDNGWYETDLKTNGRGEQDLTTYVPRLYFWKRYSITYFPKLYYKKRHGKIYLTVKINMSRYQEQLQSLEDKVETGLDCEIIKKEHVGTWMHYEFICDVKARRITVEQMGETDGCIRFMQHISWDYNRHPHALIVGDTGSGKTTFLLSIIETLLKAGAILTIVDAKNMSVAALAHVLSDVHYEIDDIRTCIENFYKCMMERAEQLREQLADNLQGNYRDCHMRPHFLILDEYVAFLEMLPKKEWEEVVSIIKKIVLLGRQAGFFLVLTCQRPDAKYLPDGVRAQFGLRVALGGMDASGYTMIFGSSGKTFAQKDEKGRGYVSLWNGVITEFYAPYATPEHNFMAHIKAAYIPGETAETLP